MMKWMSRLRATRHWSGLISIQNSISLTSILLLLASFPALDPIKAFPAAVQLFLISFIRTNGLLQAKTCISACHAVRQRELICEHYHGWQCGSCRPFPVLQEVFEGLRGPPNLSTLHIWDDLSMLKSCLKLVFFSTRSIITKTASFVSVAPHVIRFLNLWDDPLKHLLLCFNGGWANDKVETGVLAIFPLTLSFFSMFLKEVWQWLQLSGSLIPKCTSSSSRCPDLMVNVDVSELRMKYCCRNVGDSVCEECGYLSLISSLELDTLLPADASSLCVQDSVLRKTQTFST